MPILLYLVSSKVSSLQPRLSTEKEIVLDDVDFTTTGHYRCEVSGDAPMFQTASTEGILYVVGTYGVRNLDMSIRFSLKSRPSEGFPRPEMSQIKAEISLHTKMYLL